MVPTLMYAPVHLPVVAASHAARVGLALLCCLGSTLVSAPATWLLSLLGLLRMSLVLGPVAVFVTMACLPIMLAHPIMVAAGVVVEAGVEAAACVLACLFVLGQLDTLAMLSLGSVSLPEWVGEAMAHLRPLKACNSYGLFGTRPSPPTPSVPPPDSPLPRSVHDRAALGGDHRGQH